MFFFTPPVLGPSVFLCPSLDWDFAKLGRREGGKVYLGGVWGLGV